MAAVTQAQKAERLRQLHFGPGILVLPNAWDAAGALLIEQAGFAALATTGSGVAASLGRPDGERLSRMELVAAIRRISAAVSGPVSADIEVGCGATLDAKLATVRAMLDAGRVGVNLEDLGMTFGSGPTPERAVIRPIIPKDSRKDGSGALVDLDEQARLMRSSCSATGPTSRA